MNCYVYAKRNIDPAAKLQRARPIGSGAEDLSGYGPRIVEEDLKLLEFINRQIGGLDKELIKIALEDAQAKRLMTIVGVGAVSAVAISCWIGEIARFSNAKKLASYFGRRRGSVRGRQNDMGTLPKRATAWCGCC